MSIKEIVARIIEVTSQRSSRGHFLKEEFNEFILLEEMAYSVCSSQDGINEEDFADLFYADPLVYKDLKEICDAKKG